MRFLVISLFFLPPTPRVENVTFLKTIFSSLSSFPKRQLRGDARIEVRFLWSGVEAL